MKVFFTDCQHIIKKAFNRGGQWMNKKPSQDEIRKFYQ